MNQDLRPCHATRLKGESGLPLPTNIHETLALGLNKATWGVQARARLGQADTISGTVRFPFYLRFLVNNFVFSFLQSDVFLRVCGFPGETCFYVFVLERCFYVF